MAVTDKKRSTILATCAILVALVAANAASWFLFRGIRIDATEERLYTISPGVNELVAKLPEPVRIDFYWTSEQGADLPSIRAYAQRVQEFLEEIVGASDGMLELRVIDLRDVLYFASTVVAFLVLNVLAIDWKKSD